MSKEDYNISVNCDDATGILTDEIDVASTNQPICSIEEPKEARDKRSPEAIRTCNQYHRTFSGSDALEQHKNGVHRGGAHVCSVCNKRFNRGFCLRRHLRTHTGLKPHTCNLCQKSFTELHNLNEHKKIVHQGIRRYKCPICSRGFSRYSVIQKHMNTHGIPLHACDECKNTYVCASHLEIHKICIHHGVRPYHCAACDKCILKDSYIEEHLRLHETDKPCTCGRCFGQLPYAVERISG